MIPPFFDRYPSWVLSDTALLMRLTFLVIGVDGSESSTALLLGRGIATNWPVSSSSESTTLSLMPRASDPNDGMFRSCTGCLVGGGGRTGSDGGPLAGIGGGDFAGIGGGDFAPDFGSTAGGLFASGGDPRDEVIGPDIFRGGATGPEGFGDGTSAPFRLGTLRGTGACSKHASGIRRWR